MNDIEVDFTFPQEEVNIDPITEDDYDFSIFAIKGDKGDSGTNGTNGVDGNGITNIQKTGTSGLVDTYTINYTNGNSDTFNVTNGSNGQNGRDGAIQYTAGENITIANNVISASGGGDFSVYDSPYAGTSIDPVILKGLSKGIYQLSSESGGYAYFKYEASNSSTKNIICCGSTFTILKDIDDNVQDGDFIFSTYAMLDDKIANYFLTKNSSKAEGVSATQFSSVGFVKSTGDQYVFGKKSFVTLPECSVVPTTDAQLVNKKYVDDNAGGGSSIYLGKLSDFTAQSPLDLNSLEKGAYLLQGNSANSMPIYCKASYNNTDYTSYVYLGASYGYTKYDVYLYITNDIPSEVTGSSRVNIGYFTYVNYSDTQSKITFGTQNIQLRSTYLNLSSGGQTTISAVDTSNSQTISGLKTFSTLPESSVVPTTNNQLVNKKYVDDQVGAINTILATLTTPSGGN